MKDGFLTIRQQKTGTQMDIPIHPELIPIIEATVKGSMTFLMTGQGKPFTAAGFGNWFHDVCREANLPVGCAAHGLRKAAARRLAEAGCTDHEIMAITGHKSLREVARYTRAADQRKLAQNAMAKTITGTSVGKPG